PPPGVRQPDAGRRSVRLLLLRLADRMQPACRRMLRQTTSPVNSFQVHHLAGGGSAAGARLSTQALPKRRTRTRTRLTTNSTTDHLAVPVEDGQHANPDA